MCVCVCLERVEGSYRLRLRREMDSTSSNAPCFHKGVATTTPNNNNQKRKKKKKTSNNIRNNRRKRRYIGNEPGVRTLLRSITKPIDFLLSFLPRFMPFLFTLLLALWHNIIHISKYKECSPLFFYSHIFYFTLVLSLSGQCSLIEARASQRNRMNTIKLVSIRGQ